MGHCQHCRFLGLDRRARWRRVFPRDTDSYAPYLLPPKSSILYGDLPSNFGSNQISFSYYLKALNDTVDTAAANLLMFANADADIWQWTPSDQSADHVAPVHMDRGYHGLYRSSRLDADKRLGQLGQ